ncbi:MAG: hypothetical protein HOL98_05360 [Gammaproteobacteria bacterium]|nr:hypothetical protein [Gammaproteobacteria bacterium]
MRDPSRKGVIKFLIERTSKLPIHAHLLIYTMAFFVPAILIILVAVYEIQKLDENSGRLSQIKLASFNVAGVRAATGKILILADLIYASSETYLIDGAISLGNSTLASYREIDFVEAVSDAEVQQYDVYLTKVMDNLTNLSYLNAVQSQQQIDQFLADYDRNSESLYESLIDLEKSLSTALEGKNLQVSTERNTLIFGALGSFIAWLFYTLVIFRIHLHYLARPVQFLDQVAQSAIAEGELIRLPEEGPREYRSLSRSLTAYDQRLEARRQLLKIISDISIRLIQIDKVLDSHDIVIEDLQKGFSATDVIWYQRDNGYDYLNSKDGSEAPGELRFANVISKQAYCISQLSTQIGIRTGSSTDIILKDFLPTKDTPVPVDTVVGFIGIHVAGELEAFVVMVNPKQQMETIFNEESLAQIGRVISNSIERLTLEEHLEERVRSRTEDLEKEKVKAEAASIAKSSFLSTMSHEIRTPFNGIFGMADLLLQGELDEQQSLFVKTILSSSRQLFNLLSGILDFSKLEAGGIEPNRDRINLLAMFKDLVSIAKQKNQNEDLEIQMHAGIDADLYLQCDQNLIQKVVRGLIENAIQHSDAQHIVISVQASVVSDQVALLTVAVADDGLGINEQLHENLFEPFVQGETKVFAGAGLGLASFSRMVSLMGGELQVESAEGKGSRFFFELKLPVVESMAKESVRLNVFISSELYNQEQVIFLDDGSLDRSIFQLIEQLNFAAEVVQVAGEEALLGARSQESQLIFVNVAMDVVKLRDFLDVLQNLVEKGEFSDSNALVIGIGSNESDFENAFPDYDFFHGFLNTPVYARDLVDLITRSVIHRPGSKRAGGKTPGREHSDEIKGSAAI